MAIRINATTSPEDAAAQERCARERELEEQECSDSLSSQISSAISSDQSCTCECPETVRINASERDPYYLDDLGIAVEESDGKTTIRITIQIQDGITDLFLAISIFIEKPP